MLPSLSKLPCLPCGVPLSYACTENWTCGICFETLNEDSPTNPSTGTNGFLTAVCAQSHVYHKGCIRKWRDLKYNQTCPECRESLLDELIDNGLMTPTSPTTTTPTTPTTPTSPSESWRPPSSEDEIVRVSPSGVRIVSVDDRLVRRELPDGTIQYFEGESGSERLVLVYFPEIMLLQTFEGERYEEHLVHSRNFQSGERRFYAGERNRERVVRIVFPSDIVQNFEGDPGDERLVRVTYPDGRVENYRGDSGEEYLVSATDP